MERPASRVVPEQSSPSKEGKASPHHENASAATPSRPRGEMRRHRLLLLLLLLLAIGCGVQLMYWVYTGIFDVSDDATVSLSEWTAAAGDDPLAGATGPSLMPDSIGPGTMLRDNWRGALAFLKTHRKRYVVIDAKNGLGNRLRALASAMSVAEYLGRPVLLIWVRDLHLNCSVAEMFAHPLPFALLEVEIPRPHLSTRHFQLFNYMRPEPGAVKDELVDVDPDRHLFFRSAFVMNHPLGAWVSGGPQRQIRRLQPSAQVSRLLVADRSMVGLHVRNVFDAPRDAESTSATEGNRAMEGASKEYGEEGAAKLLQWRRASHWTNFVNKMTAMMQQQHQVSSTSNASEPLLRFYLAADSEDAYAGLTKRFPGRLVYTKRDCGAQRCDFRDCTSMVYSLVDMMNLARTKLILGSGYSSYSEVAAQMGGTHGNGLPILMAGRDFGTIVERRRVAKIAPYAVGGEEVDLAGFARDALDDHNPRLVQHFWPQPF